MGLHLKNAIQYRRLQQLAEEGRAQLVGSLPDPIIATPATAVMVAPDFGMCAIIYKMYATGFTTYDTSPGLGDTSVIQGFNLLDSGLNTKGSARFLAFDRVNALHAPADTPSWHSAVPCAPIEYIPADPIVVPPGWKLTTSAVGGLASNDMAGSNWVARGYMLSVADARALGFEVHDYQPGESAPSATNIRTSTIGASLTSSVVEILAGRSGQCIQIMHMHIRQQQNVHAPTITGQIQQTDNTVIFKFCNNNPSDFAEWKFSPGIYLKAGQGIEVVGDAGIKATVTIAYRFVDSADVPGDQWWAYAVPGLPSPGGESKGLGGNYCTRGYPFSLYYPRRDTSATTPGAGKQHVVEGYAMSVQKDLTDPSDRLYLALTTGDSEGQIGLGAAASGISTTNKLISPIVSVASHDQCVFLAEDDLNVPCGKDTGLVLLDSTVTGVSGGLPASPQAADLDIDEIHVLVWGRTIPTRAKGTDHFMGSVS